MYAMLEQRQRRRKKKLIIGASITAVLIVAVVCITKAVDYKKKYAEKYINKYSKYNTTYKQTDYKNKKNKNTNWGTTGDSTSISMLKFFDLDDAADVTWAHAVNSKAELDTALKDEKIMMLEADILMDPIENVPIMAHPPLNSSDITLSEWLEIALKSKRKGLKLDFKETGVLKDSIKILKKAVEDMETLPPIILNADVLSGPNADPERKPVNAKEFFNVTGAFKQSIISPGWTTGFNATNSTGYSNDDVNKMIKLINEYGIEQDITFPVRASLIPLNPKPMFLLLGQYQNKHSLTVWTSKTDVYDPKDLGFLRFFKKRVYYDLPANEIKIIKENGGWKQFVPESFRKFIPTPSK